jgi:UPF0716 family protein affecting phage T7 exclusion
VVIVAWMWVSIELVVVLLSWLAAVSRIHLLLFEAEGALAVLRKQGSSVVQSRSVQRRACSGIAVSMKEDSETRSLLAA